MDLQLVKYIKNNIRKRLLRKRFPNSVFYENVSVDRESSLGNYSVLFRDTTLINSNVGLYTYIQSNSIITSTNIGSFCSIATNVTIGLGSHPTDRVSTSPVFYDNKQPLPKFFVNTQEYEDVFPRTTIGPDVWIGQGSMIKAGIQIGVGAIVGAGAVVTKDIPPYAIIGGIPSKIIRMRFSEEICKKLVDSYWWELDETKLSECAPFFSDPEILLDFLAKK